MITYRVNRGGGWRIDDATFLAARAPQARPVLPRLLPRLPLRPPHLLAACECGPGASGWQLVLRRCGLPRLGPLQPRPRRREQQLRASLCETV